MVQSIILYFIAHLITIIIGRLNIRVCIVLFYCLTVIYKINVFSLFNIFCNWLFSLLWMRFISSVILCFIGSPFNINEHRYSAYIQLNGVNEENGISLLLMLHTSNQRMLKCYNINLITHFLQFNCHLFKSVHFFEFQFHLVFDTWNRFELTDRKTGRENDVANERKKAIENWMTETKLNRKKYWRTIVSCREVKTEYHRTMRGSRNEKKEQETEKRPENDLGFVTIKTG